MADGFWRGIGNQFAQGFRDLGGTPAGQRMNGLNYTSAIANIAYPGVGNAIRGVAGLFNRPGMPAPTSVGGFNPQANINGAMNGILPPSLISTGPTVSSVGGINATPNLAGAISGIQQPSIGNFHSQPNLSSGYGQMGNASIAGAMSGMSGPSIGSIGSGNLGGGGNWSGSINTMGGTPGVGGSMMGGIGMTPNIEGAMQGISAPSIGSSNGGSFYDWLKRVFTSKGT